MKNKKGFTLVELVIVIAVIAILAGVLIGTFAIVIENANKSKAMQEARADWDKFIVDIDYTDANKVALATSDYVIVKGNYAFKVEKGQFNSTALAYATGTTGVDGKVIKDANTTLYVGADAYTITATKTSLTAGTKYAMTLESPYTYFYVLWTE